MKTNTNRRSMHLRTYILDTDIIDSPGDSKRYQQIYYKKRKLVKQKNNI